MYNPTILMIHASRDDYADHIQMLRKHCPGCTVTQTTSLDGGFRTALDTPTDVVLLDGDTFGGDISDFCWRMKRTQETQHTMIILMCGTAVSDTVKADALSAGVDELLVKPAGTFEMASRIRSMMRIREAEERLRREKHLFEDILKEKTDELKSANQALQDDIRQRLEVEKELRTSKNRFKALAEFAPIGIYETDINGDSIFVNPKWCKMTGLSPERTNGKNWDKTLHPDDRENVMANWLTMAASEGKMGMRYRFLTPDGKITWVLGLAAPIRDNAGKITGYMGINLDITDLKHMEKEKSILEKQLRQTQKMEAIGALAGGIAHDFNNILFPIFGYIEMSLEEVQEGSFVHSNLTEILTGATRARELIKQILTFSRQSESEKKPLRIQTIIKEILKLIRASLPTTIDIRTAISNTCRPVMADPAQVHQVVMNLVTNAFQAMEEKGGILKISLDEITLSGEDLQEPDTVPGGFVCLTVADTGRGIRTEFLERIFEPYFTTKEMDRGTGLGLSIVYGIVKSHGGFITVQSESEKGATFKAYLPVIESISESVGVLSPSAAIGGQERIMLVDDEPQITKMEKRMLETMGYQVTALTSAESALEVFRRDPQSFDLVITDLTMPGMTGDRLARELSDIKPEIPVILCSGFHQRPEKLASMKEISEFVMKPMIKTEIAATIRKALDRPTPNPTTEGRMT